MRLSKLSDRQLLRLLARGDVRFADNKRTLEESKEDCKRSLKQVFEIRKDVQALATKLRNAGAFSIAEAGVSEVNKKLIECAGALAGLATAIGKEIRKG